MSPFFVESLSRAIRSFTAGATLPIYELDRPHVQNPKTMIRPFDPERGFTGDPLCPKTPRVPDELPISGWRLAHAVKKADCLRQLPFSCVAQVGFLLEQVPTLDWRSGNLRILAGVARAYADFSATSLAGRIGQGVTLLFMETQGCAFSAHYPRPANQKGPDFIFVGATAKASCVLVESKGTFVPSGAQPPAIKGALRDGLVQLNAAGNFGATKSFAVATFLRETGDTAVEPSLVAYVDPEDADQHRSDGPRTDWILRQNYAAWLDAMGLHYAASDLRTRASRKRPEARRLRVLTLNGIAFGVGNLQLVRFSGSSGHLILLPSPSDEAWCVVAGLPMVLLRAIESVLDDVERSLEIPIAASGDGSARSPLLDHVFEGSILADGSVLGLLPAGDLLRLSTQEVRL